MLCDLAPNQAAHKHTRSRPPCISALGSLLRLPGLTQLPPCGKKLLVRERSSWQGLEQQLRQQQQQQQQQPDTEYARLPAPLLLQQQPDTQQARLPAPPLLLPADEFTTPTLLPH